MPADKPGWGGARANSGGARPGSGRKPVALEPRKVAVQVLLTPKERDTLKERCAARGVSASDALRTLARLDGLID